jgi:hypothetical protein
MEQDLALVKVFPRQLLRNAIMLMKIYFNDSNMAVKGEVLKWGHE